MFKSPVIILFALHILGLTFVEFFYKLMESLQVIKKSRAIHCLYVIFKGHFPQSGFFAEFDDLSFFSSSLDQLICIELFHLSHLIFD